MKRDREKPVNNEHFQARLYENTQRILTGRRQLLPLSALNHSLRVTIWCRQNDADCLLPDWPLPLEADSLRAGGGPKNAAGAVGAGADRQVPPRPPGSFVSGAACLGGNILHWALREGMNSAQIVLQTSLF
jgi:hypothetical protein